MESTAHSDRLAGYASALMDIARAEGDVDAFVDEFYSAAKTISGTPELRETLTDARIPVGRKQGIVQDLLGPLVDNVVVASINFVIAVGETRSLEEIASRVAELVAEHEGSVVAEVQSAVALDAGQVARLEAALSKATGQAGPGQGRHRPGPHGGPGRQDRRHGIRRLGEEPFCRRTRAVGLGRWLN